MGITVYELFSNYFECNFGYGFKYLYSNLDSKYNTFLFRFDLFYEKAFSLAKVQDRETKHYEISYISAYDVHIFVEVKDENIIDADGLPNATYLTASDVANRYLNVDIMHVLDVEYLKSQSIHSLHIVIPTLNPRFKTVFDMLMRKLITHLPSAEMIQRLIDYDVICLWTPAPNIYRNTTIGDFIEDTYYSFTIEEKI